MKKINFKSDFDFILDIRDCNDMPIMWPSFDDWSVSFWSDSRFNSYSVGVTEGKPFGCYIDNGRIHVVVNDHSLGQGVLKGEIILNEPCDNYDDGVKKHVYVFSTDIHLTAGACCGSDKLTAVALLPVSSVDLFGQTVEEINDKLKDILNGGIKAMTTEEHEKLASLPTAEQINDMVNSVPPSQYNYDSNFVLIQYGMCPLGAKKGIPYNNLGYIKCGSILPGESKSFNLEFVDLSIVVDGGYFYDGELYGVIDRDNKVLSVSVPEDIMDEPHALSVRLTIFRHADVSEYLMRDEDNILRLHNCGNKFRFLPNLDLPKFHSFKSGDGFNLDSAVSNIKDLIGHYNVEIQIRSSHRKLVDGFRENKKMRWKKYHRDNISARKRMGVARIRYVTSRGRKSDWIYFSFRGNIDGFYLLISPI